MNIHGKKIAPVMLALIITSVSACGGGDPPPPDGKTQTKGSATEATKPQPEIIDVVPERGKNPFVQTIKSDDFNNTTEMICADDSPATPLTIGGTVSRDGNLITASVNDENNDVLIGFSDSIIARAVIVNGVIAGIVRVPPGIPAEGIRLRVANNNYNVGPFDSNDIQSIVLCGKQPEPETPATKTKDVPEETTPPKDDQSKASKASPSATKPSREDDG